MTHFLQSLKCVALACTTLLTISARAEFSDFSRFSDKIHKNKDVLTKLADEKVIISFDQGIATSSPYFSDYSGYTLNPGNKMTIEVAEGSGIKTLGKVSLEYYASKECLPAASGSVLNSSYGGTTTWQFAAGTQKVYFTAKEWAEATRGIAMSNIKIYHYAEPSLPYQEQETVANGTYVKIYAPGAQKIRVIYPDGSFEDMDCTESKTCNYTNIRVVFPLNASQTTIKAYPICGDWHYADKTAYLTFTQTFQNHNSSDTQIDGLYYRIVDPYDGSPSYAEVQKDARYRDMVNVTIPNNVYIDGSFYEVGSIGQSAFSGCEYLASIKLPATLRSIQARAFAGCTSLQEITIPSSVTSIDYGAFSNCTGLTQIVFPESLIRMSSKDQDGKIYPILQGCSALTHVVLPNNSSSQYSWHTNANSFLKGCESVTEITIPNNVDTLADDFFNDAESHIKITFSAKMSTFPSSIVNIPNVTLEIPASNPNFISKEGALYSVNKDKATTLVWLQKEPATGVLKLEESCIGIQKKALDGKSLKEVVYPSTLEATGLSEQLYGAKIGKLVIPANIKRLGIATFRYSDIDSLVISAAETPLTMVPYDGKGSNYGVFHSSEIGTLVLNRDIDAIDNYGWPKSYTKPFYRCKIGTLELNVDTHKNACGIFEEANVSTIKIGPDVKLLYAPGCYTAERMEIYNTNKITAPFNVDNGELNFGGYNNHDGFHARKFYVYPTMRDTYNKYSEYTYLLPGTSGIQFEEMKVTSRSDQEFNIRYITMPESLNLKWESSNPMVATVAEEGVVRTHKEGMAVITATGDEYEYSNLSASLLLEVSDTAPIEDEYAFLTLKGLGAHASRHAYKTGACAAIDIIPDTGWKIHSVDFNGTDISDSVDEHTILTPALYGENQMTIVLENKHSSANEISKDNKNIALKLGSDAVTVTGLPEKAEITVYDVTGQCIYKGSDHTLHLAKDNLYILKTEGKVFKFQL